MAVVAFLAAVVGAVTATLTDADASQASPREQTTTHGRRPVVSNMARIGDIAAVDEWRVVVHDVEAEGDVPTRVSARMTITNASKESRSWLAPERVSLRYRAPTSSATVSGWYYVVSPDTATGGNFRVAPGTSFDAYYTWVLPRGGTHLALTFRSLPHERVTQEALVDLEARPAR